MFVTYQERLVNLKQLGFSNYQEYLNSILWKIIRKHVLYRDVRFCRSRRCNNKSNIVHHLNYNVPTLIGQSPQTLITVCSECHQEIEFDGTKKRSLKDTQRRTLELVTGSNLTVGVSNPKIGFWFKNQYHSNIEVRKAIQLELQETGVLNGLSM